MFDERAVPLKILRYVGMWCPMSCASSPRKTAYHVYTALVILLNVTNTLAQFLDAILIARDIADIVDNIFVLLTYFSTCFRITNMLAWRKEIVTSMQMLATGPCKPTNEEEYEIQRKYDNIIRWNSRAYTLWIEGSVMFIIVGSLLRDVKSKELLYRAWYPFDYTSSVAYWLPYVHQIFVLIVSSLIHAATDCLISGFMLQGCCQIEILQHRLERIVTSVDTNADLRKCPYHHQRIYQYASLVNDTFNLTMSFQFCAVTLILCTSVYVLLDAKLFSIEFISRLLYLACMLTQIYILCWYGNTVTLKSLSVTDTIFGMTWMTLRSQEQKDLMLIMRRAAIPIVFRIAHIININLNSFVNILKTSYSAFNLLKQTEET